MTSVHATNGFVSPGGVNIGYFLSFQICVTLAPLTPIIFPALLGCMSPFVPQFFRNHSLYSFIFLTPFFSIYKKLEKFQIPDLKYLKRHFSLLKF